MSFSAILDNLSMAAMMLVDVEKGRFGVGATCSSRSMAGSPGGDTADPKEAKALLDELG